MAQIVHRLTREWQTAGDHLEEDDTECIKIGTDVDRPGIAKLLRGHVGPCTQPNAATGQANVSALDGRTRTRLIPSQP